MDEGQRTCDNPIWLLLQLCTSKHFTILSFIPPSPHRTECLKLCVIIRWQFCNEDPPPLPPKPNPQQLTTFLYDRDVAYGLITDGIMTKLSLWQDKNGNPPGILKSETVDPLPDLLKVMIRRLIRWHVMPSTCVPDSCIINIYEEGDCIPPHIDNHDFVRPFCTVSFLSECNIVFGSNLKIVGPGEFAGAIAIPLPVG